MTGINSRKINFKGTLGHEIEAMVDEPIAEAWGIGVFAPCFTCTKDFLAAARLCKALAHEGLAMLRLDFTGQGASKGTFAETNFSTNVGDLLKAISFLTEQGHAPSLLVGHSLGGTAALVAAAQSPSIKAVVTLNSPAAPLHVVRHFKDKEDELIWKGEINIQVAGKPYSLQRHFLEDLVTYDMSGILNSMKAALLIMHTPQDDTVLIQNASELFSKAHHPKSFISLEGSGHLLTPRQDALYISKLIAAWVGRYL